MMEISNRGTNGASRAELEERVADAAAAFQAAGLAFDEAAGAVLGIHVTDHRALSALHFRGPMTASMLAEALGLSPAAMTAVGDRLVRAGLAMRQRDEDDRRRVTLLLTDGGRERIASLWGPMREEGRRLTARYSEAELRAILDFLIAGEALQEAQARRVRAEGGRR
jgi:DNA-binding MarR family transcriptional regulator